MTDEFKINTDNIQMTEAARKIGVEYIFKEINKRRDLNPVPKERNQTDLTIIEFLDKILDADIDFDQRAELFDSYIDKAGANIKDQYITMAGCDWIEVEPVLVALQGMLKTGLFKQYFIEEDADAGTGHA